MEQNEPLELQLEHALIRLSEARALLARVIKYAREDRATTPGSTRLERAVEQASDYLARTRDPLAILRTNTVGQTKIANEPEFCVGDELEYRSERSRLRDSAKRIIERIYTNADQELVVEVRYHHTGNGTAGKHQALEERLARSSDVRDRLGTVLLGLLEKSRRITLGDAIRAAEKVGLGDDDALAAVERLARPQTASLRRFYVDRSGAQARIVSAEEVRERSAKAPDNRHEFASVTEVVWAANEADAIDGGTAYSIDTLTLNFAKHLFRVVATPCTPERPMVDTRNESGRECSAWFGGTT